MMNETLTTKSSKDYELLDTGEGQKLERYGKIVLARPDPQALWQKRLPQSAWDKADGIFGGKGKNQKPSWKFKEGAPENWQITLEGLKFFIKPTAFKHTGVFPEQVSNWQWIKEKVEGQKLKVKSLKPSVINLFGYTGGATLAAAKAGAEVTHVDGSKSAIGWARENAEASGQSAAPIRWILDDARKFIEREIKRGKRYDGIIMDPPSYGHGSKKELWKIEEDLLPLLELSFKVLTKEPVFFLMNGYAAGYSSTTYENNLKILVEKYGGAIEKGELTIAESKSDRLLPCGIFARWSKN